MFIRYVSCPHCIDDLQQFKASVVIDTLVMGWVNIKEVVFATSCGVWPKMALALHGDMSALRNVKFVA